MTSSAVFTPSDALTSLKDAAAAHAPMRSASGRLLPVSAAYRTPAQNASPAPTVPLM